MKDPRTTAFYNFKNSIGGASFLLNTIVVGLDAVEKGHQKPASVKVKWEPKDPATAARQARKFAIESFIIRAAESLKAYQAAISKLPQFSEAKSTWNGGTSAVEKLRDIARSVLGKDSFLVASGMLLIAWRNQIVHDDIVKLSSVERNLLRDNNAIIASRYADLDIDRLLVHVIESRPTLKDASSLIAMSINLVNALDEDIYDNIDAEGARSLAEHYGVTAKIKKVRRETSPSANLEKSIMRIFTTDAPGLYEKFIQFYLPDGSNFV